MNGDDLFSKLFELFNQPGPVNWKLAAEIAKHLTGERQPVEPWAAEEFRELARLAEYRVGQVAPFPVRPAPDVLPLDPRGWAEKNLESYAALVEPFGATVADGGAEALMGQLAPVIIGMQVGGLVGSFATWVMASFDAGLPPERPGSIHLIIPNIVSFEVDDVDRREVNLWVVTNEVAFRSLSEVPWVSDHLSRLVEDYAGGAPEVLREDFRASLRAAYSLDEVAEQLAATGLAKLRPKRVSDRHWAVAERMAGEIA